MAQSTASKLLILALIDVQYMSIPFESTGCSIPPPPAAPGAPTRRSLPDERERIANGGAPLRHSRVDDEAVRMAFRAYVVSAHGQDARTRVGQGLGRLREPGKGLPYPAAGQVAVVEL